MDYKLTSGERIMEARKATGMTQADLARLLSVTVAAVSHYERGTRYPDPHTFSLLARLLQEPAIWLTAIDDDKQLILLSRVFIHADRLRRTVILRAAKLPTR